MKVTSRLERRRKTPFQTGSVSSRLRRLLRASHETDAARAAELLARLAAHSTHDPAFAAELMELARGAAGDTWEIRRLACLALEHEFLRVASPDDLLAFLRGLGLLTDTGEYVHERVLQEGYSSVTVLRFAGELRRRIARHEHVHATFARDAVAGAADFSEHARHECRLVLARYLLRPAEVVERIVAQLRTTPGLPHLPRTDAYNIDEARRALRGLPPYEREIVQRLLDEAVIYWVADHTPSTLHSLLEYPIGTVVMVVKPPGSDLEIEIKRAGCRGERALDCIYQRRGESSPLPVHHHFWGGSTGRLLRWELSSGAIIARTHRLAYGTEAPSSRTVALSGVLHVPTARGDVSLVSYFGSAEGYGRGYAAMRQAMALAVPRLVRDRLHVPDVDLGSYGLTGKWLAVTSPEQAFVVGTSSFRLERLATYLAPDGDEAYFARGLGAEASNAERRRLADALLGEVLAHYTPPPRRFRSYAQYVEDAFAANRAEADAAFVEVVSQVGHYLGFFTAMRIWSEGESFVTRNVGLRNVFTGGDWKVRVHFVDHDSVSIATRDHGRWDPAHCFRGMRHDLVHVLGGTAGVRNVPGEVAALHAIYRTTPAVAESGMRAFRTACREAYFAAQDAVERNASLRKMFTRAFVKELRDWDDVVRAWTEARTGGDAAIEQWRTESTSLLRGRGYGPARAAAVINAVVDHAPDLERYAFLYRPELA